MLKLSKFSSFFNNKPKIQLDLEMESATAPQEKDYDIEKCTIKAKYLLNISDGLYPRII